MSEKKKAVASIWQKESGKGLVYLSGVMNEEVVIPKGQRFVIFANSFKEEGSKKPDWLMYIDEVQGRDFSKNNPKNEETDKGDMFL